MFSLRRKPFAAFWTGQSLALLGGNVAGFALPTVAIALLGATAAQIAALTTLQALVFPVLGMPIAALVERHRKRFAIIISDTGRFCVVSLLPLLYAVHRLDMAAVVAVAGITSVLGVVRDVAAQGYVPRLLPVDRIARGNARLELSNTAAQSAGPAIGGILMHVTAAPFALLADSLSYLGSAATLFFVHDDEPKVVRTERKSIGRDIVEALRFVLGTVALRRIALTTATLNLASSIAQVTSLLYYYRTLHLSPLVLGLIFALSNVGFLGALFAARIERRLGFVGALCVAIGLMFSGRFLLPFASFGFPVIIAAISSILLSAAQPVYNIVQLTYRQSVTPLAMQTRMNAAMRTINSVTLPIGASAGGVLAAGFGVPETLIFAALLTLGAFGWVLVTDFSQQTAQETMLRAA